MKCIRCLGESPSLESCEVCLGAGCSAPSGAPLERWALDPGWSIFAGSSRILSSTEFLEPGEEPKFFGIDDESAYRPLMAMHYRSWWLAARRNLLEADAPLPALNAPDVAP